MKRNHLLFLRAEHPTWMHNATLRFLHFEKLKVDILRSVLNPCVSPLRVVSASVNELDAIVASEQIVYSTDIDITLTSLIQIHILPVVDEIGRRCAKDFAIAVAR